MSPDSSSSSHQSQSVTIAPAPHANDVKHTNGPWEHALGIHPKDEYEDHEVRTLLAQGMGSTSYGHEPPQFRLQNATASSSRSPLNSSAYISPTPSSYSHSSGRPATSSSSFSADDPSLSFPSSVHPSGRNSVDMLRHHSSTHFSNVGDHQGGGSGYGGGSSSLPHNRPHPAQPSSFQAHPDLYHQGGSGGQALAFQLELRKSLSEQPSYPRVDDGFVPTVYEEQTRIGTQASLSHPSIRAQVDHSRLSLNHVQQTPHSPAYGGPEGMPQSSSHRPTQYPHP